jgi:hypothetical protein
MSQCAHNFQRRPMHRLPYLSKPSLVKPLEPPTFHRVLYHTALHPAHDTRRLRLSAKADHAAQYVHWHPTICICLLDFSQVFRQSATRHPSPGKTSVSKQARESESCMHAHKMNGFGVFWAGTWASWGCCACFRSNNGPAVSGSVLGMPSSGHAPPCAAT